MAKKKLETRLPRWGMENNEHNATVTQIRFSIEDADLPFSIEDADLPLGQPGQRFELVCTYDADERAWRGVLLAHVDSDTHRMTLLRAGLNADPKSALRELATLAAHQHDNPTFPGTVNQHRALKDFIESIAAAFA